MGKGKMWARKRENWVAYVRKKQMGRKFIKIGTRGWGVGTGWGD
jgi:hypothetical protein